MYKKIIIDNKAKLVFDLKEMLIELYKLNNCPYYKDSYEIYDYTINEINKISFNNLSLKNIAECATNIIHFAYKVKRRIKVRNYLEIEEIESLIKKISDVFDYIINNNNQFIRIYIDSLYYENNKYTSIAELLFNSSTDHYIEGFIKSFYKYTYDEITNNKSHRIIKEFITSDQMNILMNDNKFLLPSGNSYNKLFDGDYQTICRRKQSIRKIMSK